MADLYITTTIYLSTTETQNIQNNNQTQLNEDLDTDQKSHAHQIINFEETHVPAKQFLANQQDVSHENIQHMTEDRDHTIKDFLKRATRLEEMVIVSGGQQGDILKQWTFPQALFNKNVNMSQKANKFAYMRGAIRFYGIITTTPMTQGGLLFSYYPDIPSTELELRSTTAMQQSQTSNVEVNLNKGEPFELSVPYISVYDGISLTNPQSKNGTVICTRLTPSSGSCNIQIYASFDDDLVLEHPTPIAISSTFNPALQALDELKESRDIEAYIARINEGMRMESEVHQINKEGIISGVTSKLSQITKIASGLPLVGSVARMATPILDIGTSLAKTFGFSKPNQDKPVRSVRINPFNDHLTAEGVRQVSSVNYHFNNSVQSAPGEFGTDLDEMNIEEICRRKQLIPFYTEIDPISDKKTIGRLSTSEAPYDILAVIPICPSDWFLPLNPSFYKTVGLYTHFAWLFSFFRFWSATLNFEIKFYMTAFHKAQLRIAFVPQSFTTTDFSILDYNSANSSVVAINSENSVINFTVPALRHTQRLMTFNYNQETLTPMNNAGFLVIMNETRLVAPENVSPSIPFVIMAHLTDVELSVPAVNFTLNPINPVETQEVFMNYEMFSIRTHDEVPTQAQIIEGKTKLATTSTASSAPNVTAKNATGENTTSLKQILNCYTRMANLTVSGTSGVLTRLAINPFAYTEAGTLHFNSSYHDLIDSVMAGFAFFKGGMMLRIIPQTPNLNASWKFWISDYKDMQNKKFQVFTTPTTGEQQLEHEPVSGRVVPIAPMLDRGIEVHVPYNQPTSKMLVHPDIASLDFQKPQMNTFILDWESLHVGTDAQQIDVYRCCAEDTRFGFLYSLPPMARYFRHVTPTP